MNENQHNLRLLLQDYGMVISTSQCHQFEIYFHELIRWNEKINLTAITNREQVYIKHFYDSLSLSFFVKMNKIGTLADIGSGAGFPGIPLKIAFPHLKLTIIDSLQKRINFLQHIADVLHLTDVELIHGRAEEVGREVRHRDSYDLVTARAVAKMTVLNELCLPFVRTGGFFVAMKGSSPTQEMEEAEFSFDRLHGKVKNIHRFKLPGDKANRHFIIVEKFQATPSKYPRKAGTPAKAPLYKETID